MCLFVDKARLSICITNLNFSKLWGFLSPWSIFLTISFSTLNRTDQTFIFLLVFVKDLVHMVVTNYLNEVWRQWHWQRGDLNLSSLQQRNHAWVLTTYSQWHAPHTLKTGIPVVSKNCTWSAGSSSTFCLSMRAYKRQMVIINGERFAFEYGK